MLRNSPFGRPADTTRTGSAVQALEFRGVMFDDGKEYYSVHETKTRSSQWIGLNEPGNPYTVRAFDATKGILTVEYQGGVLALPLKDAVIVVSSAGKVPAVPTAPAVAGAGVKVDDRMAQVIEQTRRQRAAKLAQLRN